MKFKQFIFCNLLLCRFLKPGNKILEGLGNPDGNVRKIFFRLFVDTLKIFETVVIFLDFIKNMFLILI